MKSAVYVKFLVNDMKYDLHIYSNVWMLFITYASTYTPYRETCEHISRNLSLHASITQSILTCIYIDTLIHIYFHTYIIPYSDI